jgi:hypothetical protein
MATAVVIARQNLVIRTSRGEHAASHGAAEAAPMEMTIGGGHLRRARRFPTGVSAMDPPAPAGDKEDRWKTDVSPGRAGEAPEEQPIGGLTGGTRCAQRLSGGLE